MKCCIGKDITISDELISVCSKYAELVDDIKQADVLIASSKCLSPGQIVIVYPSRDNELSGFANNAVAYIDCLLEDIKLVGPENWSRVKKH